MLAQRYASKEFKAMAKCGAKDVATKGIFAKMDTGVKELVVIMRDVENIKVRMVDAMKPSMKAKRMMSPTEKRDHAQLQRQQGELLLKLFKVLLDLLKATSTSKFKTAMIENCPTEVVAYNVAGAKIAIKALEKQRLLMKAMFAMVK
jgi:hypothetical protein